MNLIECIPMPPLSAEKIELIITKWLKENIPDHLLSANNLTLNQIERILVSNLDYSILLVESLPANVSAQTDFSSKIIMMTESFYSQLENGNGYALFTVAHELAHIILHSNYVLHSLPLAARQINSLRQEIKTYESSEWQAEHGGGAILMPILTLVPFIKQLEEKRYRMRDIIELIAEKYGVTEKAAESRIRAIKKDNLSKIRLFILAKTA